MKPAIEVRDLFRVYSTPEGDAAALQGLTVSMREGEVSVVLGPSGSGKTTLLRILAGLDQPSAGTARVFGLEIGKLSPKRLARYRAATLGYIDQHYSRSLAPELTAREIVSLGLRVRGIVRSALAPRADELLDRAGLGDRRDARPTELSGGEQQRVAVCAALAHRPRVLLADEPTGELDHANAARVYELIGELAREHGCTTLIVSHDPESATIADRIVRIRDGRVAEETARSGGREAIVVGRGGWLRLPEELLARAGIRTRAGAELDERGVLVIPTEGGSDEARILERRPRADEPAGSATTSGGPAAQVRSLVKTFGSDGRGTTVFTGLDASLARGKLIVVTGPSGSGKTTLLHLLSGLELPTAGDVLVLGTPLHELDRDARARFRRNHIGVVGQEPGLVPFLSARENVELGLALRAVPSAEASERALEILAAVGLAERSDQRVVRLSAGERERVALARALVPRPELLLADEPTSRLDQANALSIASLFARLGREAGSTIVCATHDPLVIEQADEELALGGSSPMELEARPAAFPTEVR